MQTGRAAAGLPAGWFFVPANVEPLAVRRWGVFEPQPVAQRLLPDHH